MNSECNEDRVLTGRLRELAANDRKQPVPLRIEENLRSAFRARTSQRTEKATRRDRGRLAWALAAAAAMVLLLFAGTSRGRHESPAPQVGRIETTPTVQPEMARVESPLSSPPPARVRSIRRRARKVPVQLVQTAASEDSKVENTTGFVPLMYGSGLPPGEVSNLVRVKIARPALASFGLPVNLERSNEPVKADVLLGEDGLARAIRFVH